MVLSAITIKRFFFSTLVNGKEMFHRVPTALLGKRVINAMKILLKTRIVDLIPPPQFCRNVRAIFRRTNRVLLNR